MSRGSRIASFFLLSTLLMPAHAFVVEDIRIEGLERIRPGVVFNELPIRVGDSFSLEMSESILAAVYRTAYFDDVSLHIDGARLIIRVRERAGIAAITIEGNTEIPEEVLMEGFEKSGLSIGEVYNETRLERFRGELIEQYYSLGKYNTRVDIQLRELPDNRVAIDLRIYEGRPSRIADIRFIGNRRIKDEVLYEQIELAEQSWYEFWSDSDEYSRERLLGDLERIRAFYLDRGFLDFEVENTEVSLSPDKEKIYIVISLKEGKPYRLSGFDVAGATALSRQEIASLIQLKKGGYYSQSEVLEASENIRYRLNSIGYAAAEVNPLPEVDVDKAEARVLFVIDPKAITYVRRINFYGNEGTSDHVFRSEMRQMESAVYSREQIEQSKKRLSRLPYIRSIEMNVNPLPESQDMVDLDVQVEEQVSGNFNVGAGFSDSEGAVLSFSINQDNFLGSGKRVNFTFNNSDSNTIYSLRYFDPFFTIGGISREWGLRYQQRDYAESDIAASDTDELSLLSTFGIPVSENDTFYIGGRIQDLKLDLREGPDGRPIAGEELRNFVENEGDSFTDFSVNGRFDYDTRNRALFPSDGSRITGGFSWTVPGSDLKYYKLDYTHKRYQSLDDNEDFIVATGGQVAYADSYGSTTEVPYYSRYYAGGTKTVRGYQRNSLGPRDSRNDPIGGNFSLIGNFNLYFPTDFLYDRKSLRMSLFTDVGNVFTDYDEFSLSDMRGSYGLQVQWLTALGGVSFNFASHYNNEQGDRTEGFQFDLGTRF